MTAGKYDFIMDQGAYFTKTFLYTDADGNIIDLTGYTGKAMLKTSFDDTVSLLTFDTTDGSMVLGGALGTIQLVATSEVTSLLSFDTAYYDIALYPAGNISLADKPLYGTITLREKVTDNE